MLTKRERLKEREQAILSAATRAFRQGGMKAARMAEIARAADVAEGTIYLYYRNKEALFAAVVAEHWKDLTRGAREAINGAGGPEAQLEALAGYTLRRILADWKLFELTFLMTYSGTAQEDLTDRQSYVRVFDSVLSRGADMGVFRQVDTRALRDLFFGTIDYTARSALARGESAVPANAVSFLMNAMRASLSPEAAPNPEEAPPPLIDRLEIAVAKLERLAAIAPGRD
jgi:AcrR family transcriptional regulator